MDYTYDNLHRLLSETITVPGQAPEVTTYTMDAVGNRLSREECTGDPLVCQTTAYAYNDNNQLISETGSTYAYTYFFDSNGNTVERFDGTNSVFYEYDYKNRMIETDTGADVVEYAYDSDGLRVSKSVDGIAVNYLVDKNLPYAQVLEERNAAKSLLASYVHGLDLISMKRGTKSSFYHYDGLGSTRALTSSTQAITDTWDYTAYGETWGQSGTTDNAYLFTGEQYDDETGLTYLRARYYEPGTGRFVSADEWSGNAQDPLTLNKYLYGHSNPVSYIDPSGHLDFFTVTIGVAIAAAIMTVISDNVLAAASNKSKQLKKLNFDVGGLQVAYQQEGVSCWAAAYASMAAWNYNIEFKDPEEALWYAPTGLGSKWAAEYPGHLSYNQTLDFIVETGLFQTTLDNIGSPMTWARALLLNGPLMTALDSGSDWIHWIVIYGISGDGTDEGTSFSAADPTIGLVGPRSFGQTIDVAFWDPAHW